MLTEMIYFYLFFYIYFFASYFFLFRFFLSPFLTFFFSVRSPRTSQRKHPVLSSPSRPHLFNLPPFLTYFLLICLSSSLSFFLHILFLTQPLHRHYIAMHSLLLSHLLLARRSLYFPSKIHCTLCVLGN